MAWTVLSSQQAIDCSVEATKRVLVNIAGSDLVTEYGTKPMYGLREYREDIAIDIFETLVQRKATDEEKDRIHNSDWHYEGVLIGPERSQIVAAE